MLGLEADGKICLVRIETKITHSQYRTLTTHSSTPYYHLHDQEPTQNNIQLIYLHDGVVYWSVQPLPSLDVSVKVGHVFVRRKRKEWKEREEKDSLNPTQSNRLGSTRLSFSTPP